MSYFDVEVKLSVNNLKGAINMMKNATHSVDSLTVNHGVSSTALPEYKVEIESYITQYFRPDRYMMGLTNSGIQWGVNAKSTPTHMVGTVLNDPSLINVLAFHVRTLGKSSVNGYLAIQWDGDMKEPSLVDLLPMERLGLPLIFPEHCQVLCMTWEGDGDKIPDCYLDGMLLLPQHKKKMDALWNLRKKYQNPPQPLVDAVDSIPAGAPNQDHLFRLLFWLFLDNKLAYYPDDNPFTDPGVYRPTQITQMGTHQGLIAKDAGGIIVRVLDGHLSTLADIVPVVLEGINPENAESWATLLEQQANLMREKAAQLDIYKQLANLRK